MTAIGIRPVSSSESAEIVSEDLSPRDMVFPRNKLLVVLKYPDFFIVFIFNEASLANSIVSAVPLSYAGEYITLSSNSKKFLPENFSEEGFETRCHAPESYPETIPDLSLLLNVILSTQTDALGEDPN